MEKVSDVILYKHRTMVNGLVKRIAITASVVVISFGSVLYSSCKKDSTTQPSDTKCINVVCQNGGTCMSGVCYCPAGYEGDKCEQESVSRYVGEWDVTETINGSSKPANVGRVNLYVMKIRKGSKALDILIDNFMGQGYKNISGVIGRKYGGGILLPDVMTRFVLNTNQTISGTYITILEGAGSVNQAGTEMSCTYRLQYLDAGVVVKDSVSFLASYKQ